LCHRVAGQQLVHPPEDERDDARRKGAGDRAGDQQPGRRAGEGRQGNGGGLDQEGKAQRAAEAGTVGQRSSKQWASHGAKPEHHPVAGAHLEPPVEEAGNEVDQEHHEWDEPGRVQPVSGQKRPDRSAH
jgi:hypothetical protein